MVAFIIPLDEAYTPDSGSVPRLCRSKIVPAAAQRYGR